MHEREHLGLEASETADRRCGCSRERGGVKHLLCSERGPNNIIVSKRGSVAGMGKQIATKKRLGRLLKKEPSFPVVRNVWRIDVPNLLATEINDLAVGQLAPWEAVLGTSVAIPTFDGKVNIKIPPGTQNGRKLRVRERGLPQRSGPAGDMIVVVRLEVPEKVNEEERKLWTQLAEGSK